MASLEKLDAREANIPNSFTPEEVAEAVTKHIADGDVQQVVLLTHYNSTPLGVAEVYWRGGKLILTVRAEAPPR